MMRVFLGLAFAYSLLAISSAHAEDAKSCRHDKALAPLVATHGFPPYPAEAVAKGQQGTVLMDVQIGDDGVPTDVQIATSSGYSLLDETARNFVKNTWRWEAPTKKCLPTATATKVSLQWDLKNVDANPLISRAVVLNFGRSDYPDASLARRTQGIVIITLALMGGDKPPIGFVNQSSGDPDLDKKSLELVSTRHHWTLAEMDGAPVKTTVFVAANWTLH
jgi:TonB family protein